MVVGHRNSPVGHGTLGIFLRYLRESLVCFLVPKRMEHRHRAIELRLKRRITRSREIYFTKLSDVTGRMFMLMLSNGWRDECPRKSNYRDEGKRSHEKVLLRLRVNFRAFFHKLFCFFLEPDFECDFFSDPLRRCEFPNIFGDFHRAKVRTTHAAEMCALGAFGRKSFIVKFARGFRIE